MPNRPLLKRILIAGCIVATYLGFFPNIVTGVLTLEGQLPEVVTNSQSWGTLQFNRSISKTPLSIQGRRYWRGFGTHAASTIRVHVPSNTISFEGACGIDDQGREKGEFTCAIRKNGTIVWETSLVNKGDPIHFFRIPLSSGDAVELIVRSGKAGIDYAHANWVSLRFKEQ